MTTAVERNDERSRYELVIDGDVRGIVRFAAIAAEGEPTVLHISHAEVALDLRGKGFSEPMVRAALDDVRTRGERVVSTCWYVSSFLGTHPEYADLMAEGSPS